MRFFIRPNIQRTASISAGAAGDQLASVRAESTELLRAADEAIDRALSGNSSESFLRAGRQQGGQ